ncbi:MAG TPA: SDR family oxidoreductase [Acidimicrobiales bacterium]|nr:SDR family oxidoreductase [Acidimicrobiales bacterium]
MTKLLDGKNAIIYGGAGGIGTGVARRFVEEGAHVFLVGRTRETLDRAAKDVGATGIAVFDALDEAAVDQHVRDVVSEAGSVDVSLNLITRGDVQGIPLVDMTTDDLLRATTIGLTSNFLTARAAARQMIEQGHGVVIHLNSASGDGAMPGMGSTGPADAAVESFMRYLAAELGPHGVRVCGIHTAGVADTLTRDKLADVDPNQDWDPAAIERMIAGMSVMDRAPRLADVAGAATFLASDLASGMTGSVLNATAGLVLR